VEVTDIAGNAVDIEVAALIGDGFRDDMEAELDDEKPVSEGDLNPGFSFMVSQKLEFFDHGHRFNEASILKPNIFDLFCHGGYLCRDYGSPDGPGFFIPVFDDEIH
jgi:hypothetical protein